MMVAGQVAAAKEGAGATGAAATAAAPAGEGAGACMCAQRQNSTDQSIREAFAPAAHISSLQQLAAARQSAHVSPACNCTCPGCCLCPACSNRIPVRPAGRLIRMHM